MRNVLKKKTCNVLPYYNQFLLQVNNTLKFLLLYKSEKMEILYLLRLRSKG